MVGALHAAERRADTYPSGLVRAGEQTHPLTAATSPLTQPSCHQCSWSHSTVRYRASRRVAGPWAERLPYPRSAVGGTADRRRPLTWKGRSARNARSASSAVSGRTEGRSWGSGDAAGQVRTAEPGECHPGRLTAFADRDGDAMDGTDVGGVVGRQAAGRQPVLACADTAAR